MEPQPLEPYLQQIWDAHRDQSQAHLMMIERAITDAVEGRLADDLRDSAAHEAHRLCGAVGSLGFTAASKRLRELENALVAGPLAVSDATVLLASLGECRHELFGPPSHPRAMRSNPDAPSPPLETDQIT
jgi:HPt (histidine-containing phosphotransfer) domain-containing protein